MIREVLAYPDKLLKQISEPVWTFDNQLHQLLDDMYDTMIAKNGVGLAAVQIGVPQRILVINIPDEEGNQHRDNLIEVINPEILEGQGNLKSNEGCLSVPEYYDDVDRFQKIKIRYFNRHGEEVIEEPEDFLAVAFQHEMDHLEGKLFIDRISIMKRKRFEKDYKKIIKGKKRL